MTRAISLGGLTVVCGLIVATPALADCKAELAEVDQRLAAAELDPQMTHVMKTFRDQGAALCAAGDETGAGARFTSINSILDTQATAKPAAPEPAVEKVPFPESEVVYIDENGEGILRYSVPGGKAGELYWFATGAFSGDPDRPIETLSSGDAAFTGPHIARYIWGLTGKGVPVDRFVMSLYQREPYRHVAHFRFVVDPSKAEPRENCGEIDIRTDECANKLP